MLLESVSLVRWNFFARYCVVQVYNQHKRGIIAHKDKEQDSSTPICGLSLGAARVLSMSRPGTILCQPIHLNLFGDR